MSENTPKILISLSGTPGSAASKKTRILKQLRNGTMTIWLAEKNRENDPLLGAKLTQEEIFSAARGEPSKRAKNAVMVEITEEEAQALKDEEEMLKNARAEKLNITEKDVEAHHAALENVISTQIDEVRDEPEFEQEVNEEPTKKTGKRR